MSSAAIFRCDKMEHANFVIIDGKNVNEIDTTVAKNLSLMLSDLEARKQKLLYWNWHVEPRSILVTFDSSNEPLFRNCANVAQLVSGE